MSDLKTLLCAECGGELEKCDSPAPLFMIPFTKLEVWRWEKTTYCLHCCSEQDRVEHEQIYDVGAQDGYMAGLREAGRT